MVTTPIKKTNDCKMIRLVQHIICTCMYTEKLYECMRAHNYHFGNHRMAGCQYMLVITISETTGCQIKKSPTTLLLYMVYWHHLFLLFLKCHDETRSATTNAWQKKDCCFQLSTCSSNLIGKYLAKNAYFGLEER